MLPAYNQRFAVPASEARTVFIPWIGMSHAEILCVQDGRVAVKDNTVRYQGRSFQIPPDPHRSHYVKVTIRGTSTRMGRWRCSMALGAWRGIVPRAISLAKLGRRSYQETEVWLGLRPDRRSQPQYDRSLFQEQMKFRG